MKRRHLRQDILIIALSLVFAWAIVHFGWVPTLLSYTGGHLLVSAFIAGMFFSSLTTTAPAIAVLGELALHGSLPQIALVGASGAIISDLLLFEFLRDRVADDLSYLLKRTGTPRFFKLFHRKTFRRLLPFVGGLIIASPLPDELALGLMQAAHTSRLTLMLTSFGGNVLGILMVGLAARSLS